MITISKKARTRRERADVYERVTLIIRQEQALRSSQAKVDIFIDAIFTAHAIVMPE